MKKINSTDILFLLLFMTTLNDIDFTNWLDYVAVESFAVWIGMMIYKLKLMRRKKEGIRGVT
ncbi:hypothetical protein [Tepidibacillus decaturensis]|uniref:Uncharacterized protein n=1 Tax=Tepidibacillus decaturensis TaxID=1413211 RepID=A0A135L1K8_9BACI|nr:hypothetical protein [Tepidibacillus decaturensis]KXG42891.1 hypothetical protein U473_01725 [Tepidibacillus decaturensis]